MTPPTLTSWSHKRRSVFKTFSPGTEESPQERPCPLSGSPSQDTAPQLAGMWGVVNRPLSDRPVSMVIHHKGFMHACSERM